MKKGIILEQHRKYTILMTKDGAFEKGKVFIKDAKIGEEVAFKPIRQKKFLFLSKHNKRHFPARILTIACIILICFLPFYFFPNDKTYAYVTIDINPSIELEVDENYTVRNIRAMNNDAYEIMEELTDYLNENLEIVIQMIMNTSEKNGLINDEKNILIGISYINGEKTDERKILKEIESHFGQNKPDWNLAAFNVPKDIRDLANEQETSMNKVMAKQLIIDQEPKSIQILQNDDILDISEVEIIDTFFKTTDTSEEKAMEEDTAKEEVPQKNHEKEIESDLNIEDEVKGEVNSSDSSQESEVEEQAETNEDNEEIPIINEPSKDAPHPSDLKGKNGEINSNGNNIKKNKDHHPNHKKDDDKEKDENHPSNNKGNNGNNE
ncbi:anti-sigma factor domain-containing protein [Oceanobacillus sp. Castelsardo]|uniref:anti-sigma factor domain-containing protein n=1 Tax=Oceanobacillus sp. Castelsardo TaxID=1851204 RepID=UPI00083942FA|nr:anti-sigma factor domain-containing protein [Oceanobacillus sp. Castelsardo]